MDIYLLPEAAERFRLFAPEVEATQPHESYDDSPQTVSRWKRFAAQVKRGYQAATRRSRRPERVLKSLRDVGQIVVHYPPRMDADQAGKIYQALVEKQIRKHRRWLIVNGALIPFGVLLTVIPGPNVFLAYLAWRTLAHYRSQKGGKNAGKLEIIFRADPDLEALDELAVRRFAWQRRRRMAEEEKKLIGKLMREEPDLFGNMEDT